MQLAEETRGFILLTLEVARVAGGICFARVRVLAAKRPF